MKNALTELEHFPPLLLEHCLQIATRVREAGGRALLVGGCVRDTILKLAPKDVDMEVFGLEADRLEALLETLYQVDKVGRSFCVLKLRGQPIDVSLPRRESKQGRGHTAFVIEGDPHMPFEEAASRRDFTLNAISWDPLTGELIDPHHGQSDLINGILRHTGPQFVEDPLRVLRAMQFVARFRLEVAPETVRLCQTIEPEDLSQERVGEEWFKLLLQGVEISRGLHFLKESGWLRYYPELEALIGCQQDPRWHPEGDVWEHTLRCLDAFARERTGDAQEDLIVGLAVLCHDLGKPATTVVEEDGRVRSPAHDIAGLEPSEALLARLSRRKDLPEEVLPLVRCHMQPADLYRHRAGDAAVRRLARRVGRIDRLVRLDAADSKGRLDPWTDGPSEHGRWLLARAEELAVREAAPQALLLGRHLIELGVEPGPNMGKLLEACYDAQVEGNFSDLEGAIAFAKALLAENR